MKQLPNEYVEKHIFTSRKIKKQQQKFFDLKSDRVPQRIGKFQKRLVQIGTNNEIWKLICEFQGKINMEIKNIKVSSKKLTLANKTSNFYNFAKEKV